MNFSLISTDGRDRRKYLDRQIIDDLFLERFLDESIADFILSTCGKDDITERQKVFRVMEDKSVSDRMEALLRAVLSFSRTYETYENATTEFDKCFGFYCLYRLYTELLSLSENDCDSFFLKRLDENARLARLELESAGEKMARFAKLLKSVEQLLLCYSAGGVAIECTDESDGVCGAIDRCAESLGYTLRSRRRRSMRVPAVLAGGISRKYAEQFSEMRKIAEEVFPLIHGEIAEITEHLRFYLGINGVVLKNRVRGITSCFPRISDTPKYTADGVYDVSLEGDVVPNDVRLTSDRGVYFVRGANGGGKTTYARACGINLVLFLAGCPIFARNAEIYPFDTVYTHFPDLEDFNQGGRLDNEERAIRESLERTEGTSFFIFNETFSSTGEEKAAQMAAELLTDLKNDGHFALFVTHLRSPAGCDIPSLCAAVEVDAETSGNRRTFKITESASFSSYAEDILKKYGIDGDSLAEGLLR